MKEDYLVLYGMVNKNSSHCFWFPAKPFICSKLSALLFTNDESGHHWMAWFGSKIYIDVITYFLLRMYNKCIIQPCKFVFHQNRILSINKNLTYYQKLKNTPSWKTRPSGRLHAMQYTLSCYLLWDCGVPFLVSFCWEVVIKSHFGSRSGSWMRKIIMQANVWMDLELVCNSVFFCSLKMRFWFHYETPLGSIVGKAWMLWWFFIISLNTRIRVRVWQC
jgi:hypothetical protein